MRKSSVRPVVDVMEARQLMSASSVAADIVYLETNNPLAGQNAILAYRRDPTTGALDRIGAKPYYTAGTGYSNPTNALGPDDSDKEILVSPNHKFLFAVNQGSNTVASFAIKSDGSLKLITGAAFKSGGTQPISLAATGNRLYVLNRGDEIQGSAGTVGGSLIGFKINADGTLAKIAGAKASFAVGTSPSQVLIANDGKSLFVDLFTPPPLLSVENANKIVPFKIKGDGSFAAGAPVGADVTPPLVLGLAQHPTQRIVYAGLVGAKRLGVYTYGVDGALTLKTSVPNAGGAICWLEVSADGKWLYTSDSGTDSIGVYSLANPLKPTEVQELQLNGPRNGANDAGKPLETVNFQLSLDPSGKFLYALNHQVAAGQTFTDGNQLHVLKVNTDGTLVEYLKSPLKFSTKLVVAGAHPQGLAVIS